MSGWIVGGAGAGFVAVALGAFGAHGLARRVPEEQLKTFRTGVDYQFYHAFALVAVGILATVRPGPVWNWAGWCFVMGILLFSGSLYGLTVKRWPRRLGLVTPLGGALFLTGWVLLGWASLGH